MQGGGTAHLRPPTSFTLFHSVRPPLEKHPVTGVLASLFYFDLFLDGRGDEVRLCDSVDGNLLDDGGITLTHHINDTSGKFIPYT